MTNKLKILFNGDRNFKTVITGSALCILILVFGTFATLIYSSYPAFAKFGFAFISGGNWDPIVGEFAAMPFLFGTLLTSFLALLISFPVSLTIAIFLGEYFKSGILHTIIKSAVELLAGIPSIIYGFWGLFILVPVIRDLEILINVPPYGVGILSSAIVLAIMIIPYSASISREVISMTPLELKEACYSLGATRYEVLKGIVLPYSASGIISGLVLSLGRALGETMAVTMVIGNSNIFPDNIFSPSNTMASVIANEFSEATDDLHLSSLIALGLLLLIVSAIVNISGKYLINKLFPIVK